MQVQYQLLLNLDPKYIRILIYRTIYLTRKYLQLVGTQLSSNIITKHMNLVKYNIIHYNIRSKIISENFTKIVSG